MRSCPEEMGWEIGRFWKRFSWVLTMVLRSWVPAMVLRSWGPTMVFRSWSPIMQLKFDIGPWRQAVEFSAIFGVSTSEDELRSETPRDWGGVSIVWLRKTFKNCFSLLVSKNWSQKLICGSYLNNGVHLCIWIRLCIWLRLYLYLPVSVFCILICNAIQQF